MRRADMVNAVVRNTGLSKQQVKIVVESVIHQLIEGVNQGKHIELRGFGSFNRVLRKGRSGWDFKAKHLLRMQDKLYPKFKPSKQFLERLNATANKL